MEKKAKSAFPAINAFRDACNRLAELVNHRLFEDCRDWWWVGDEIGGLCCFDDDDFLTPEQMVLILEEGVTYDQYEEWNCANLDNQEKGYINLYSWLRGCRHEMLGKPRDKAKMYIQEQHWEGTCDRLLLALPELGGTVQVDILLTDERKERYHADCLLWGLWVDEDRRKDGVATYFVQVAEFEAKEHGCKSIALEWSEQESQLWVRDWYERLGYEEKVFGKGYLLMVKELK